jgi:hypothetical protein
VLVIATNLSLHNLTLPNNSYTILLGSCMFYLSHTPFPNLDTFKNCQMIF